jgi:hypothetical protein
VVVLDSAGYGTVTIIQSVSIVAPTGVYAGVSATTGHGIVIDANTSDVITLSGLTINGQGTSGSGIVFNNGGALHVKDCIVNGFSSHGDGLFFNGNNFGNNGILEVKDSIFRGNVTGIHVEGTALTVIDRVRVEGNNGDGIDAFDGAKVTVRNSLIAGNGGTGTFAFSTGLGLGPAELNVERCVISNNAAGVVSESDSTFIASIRISNSTVTDNTVGLRNNGAPAALLSRSSNTVEGNGTNMSGAITLFSAK